jgi:hypothetical protein
MDIGGGVDGHGDGVRHVHDVGSTTTVGRLLLLFLLLRWYGVGDEAMKIFRERTPSRCEGQSL